MSIAVTPPSLWISKTNIIVSITFSIYKNNNLQHALSSQRLSNWFKAPVCQSAWVKFSQSVPIYHANTDCLLNCKKNLNKTGVIFNKVILFLISSATWDNRNSILHQGVQCEMGYSLHLGHHLKLFAFASAKSLWHGRGVLVIMNLRDLTTKIRSLHSRDLEYL